MRPSTLALLLLALPAARAPQDRGAVLTKKWEFKIMERVYLPSPSGWINQFPWLLSSPALGDLGHGGRDLEVVTGTEEGYGEWFPRGTNSGRYIGISSKGAKLWDYETRNNAGRASPAVADLDGDGALDCLGGSTSGWMVHAFGGDGRRRWTYECANNQNVLAPPACADLTPDAGVETVAIAADGAITCLSAAGRQLWRATPADTRGYYAAASPAIGDLDGDNKPDVVASLLGRQGHRVYCLDGATGATKWTSEALPGGNNTVTSSPALLPKADP
jgi:outer membrane protein assembly factor BamB